LTNRRRKEEESWKAGKLENHRKKQEKSGGFQD